MNGVSIYRMRIVLDTRETALFDKCTSLLPLSVKSLAIGDAAIQNEAGHDILLFERKSIPDLLASIKDGRYEEQSHRLIHASGLHPHNIVYIVEGALAQIRNPADKKIVLSAITSLSFFKGFSVLRTASIQETGELICSMAAKIHKEYEKGKPVPTYSTSNTFAIDYSNFVKKTKHENITPENISEILLCQIPGISSGSAKEILQAFGGSFYQLMTEIRNHPEKLDTLYLSGGGKKPRKLGSNIIQNLRLYLNDVRLSVPASDVPVTDTAEDSRLESVSLPLP